MQMSKQPDAVVTFAPGSPITPSKVLLDWLNRQRDTTPGRRVRLPVIVRLDGRGITEARIGLDAARLEPETIALALVDTAMGISLADRLRKISPVPSSCVVWLDGYWSGERTGSDPACWSFSVRDVHGRVAEGDRAQTWIEAEPQATSRGPSGTDGATPPAARGTLSHLAGTQVGIEGRAENAKGGAVLLVDGTPVYLENLASWPQNVHGKVVVVTGLLVSKKHLPSPTVSATGEVSQGAEGDQWVVEGATWREQTGAPAGAEPAVEMSHIRVDMGKPPLVRLFFDVVLRNHEATARWFIIPAIVPPIPRPDGAGVDGLAPFSVGGKKHAILGRFRGTGGFYAARLPARGILKLSGLEIEHWSSGDAGASRPALLPMEISTATELLLGGEPAERWFRENPLCDDRIEQPAASWTPLPTFRTADGKEVPATQVQATRISLSVPLTWKR